MKFIEMTGKSVDEAIKNALKELNITKDRAIIDIIDEGSKGFLSLIGNKPAKVKVTVKRDYVEEAYDFIRSVLDSMGILAEIKIKEDNDVIKINLTGPKMGLVIGILFNI